MVVRLFNVWEWNGAWCFVAIAIRLDSPGVDGEIFHMWPVSFCGESTVQVLKSIQNSLYIQHLASKKGVKLIETPKKCTYNQNTKERYCWWTKSCTTKDDDYPIIYRVLTIPGWLAVFLPSTVWRKFNSHHLTPFATTLRTVTQTKIEVLFLFGVLRETPHGMQIAGWKIFSFSWRSYFFSRCRWTCPASFVSFCVEAAFLVKVYSCGTLTVFLGEKLFWVSDKVMTSFKDEINN